MGTNKTTVHDASDEPPQDQAARHAQARQARAGALLEDYAELIDDLLAEGGEARPTDIARRLGVSHGTAIKTINRLKREGLAHAKPYRGVFLTEAGGRSPGGRGRGTAWW
jgi:DtxR family manganese transport transcriptional regulator